MEVPDLVADAEGVERAEDVAPRGEGEPKRNRIAGKRRLAVADDNYSCHVTAGNFSSGHLKSATPMPQ